MSAVVLSRPARSTASSTICRAGSCRRVQPAGRTQPCRSLLVEQSVHQTVRAEKEQVARLARHRADLRIDELIARAERLLQHVAARMRARLAFVELAVAVQPTHVGIVLR